MQLAMQARGESYLGLLQLRGTIWISKQYKNQPNVLLSSIKYNKSQKQIKKLVNCSGFRILFL